MSTRLSGTEFDLHHTAATASLRGLRVLELGDSVKLGFCGRILAWLGADVVRFEATSADVRHRLSVDGDEFGVAAYDYCHDKKTISGSEAPADALLAELDTADIVLTDLMAEQLVESGLDPVAFRRDHPGRILVSVTDYGLTGPNANRAGSELTNYQEGGEGHLLPGDPVYSLYPDREPVRGGRHLSEYDAGLAAAVGTLAAVLNWTRSDAGDVVEVSAQEVQLGLNRTSLSRCFYEKLDIDRGDRGYDYGGLLQASDGWVTLRPTEDGQWHSFARAIGRADLADDPRYATRVARDRNGAELTHLLETWSRGQPRAAIREVLIAAECPGGPFLEVAEVLDDETLIPRELFVETAGGSAPGRLFRLASESVDTTADSGYHQHGADAGGPLAGLRVIDLTWVAAGPYATEMLALLGAEVIKVESRDRPDLFRRLLLANSADLDTSIRFVDLNQAKKSICVDIKAPAGRDLLTELAAASDVIIDNFRPGVRERLGLGDDALRTKNPGLVGVSLSGFGATGPLVSRPGYASVFNAESGIGAMTGYADASPTEIRDSNDLRAGMGTACAALAGLIDRERHGRVTSADVSAREVLIALQGDAFLEASRGLTPTRSGNRLGRQTPYGCWQSGDGHWIAVSVTSDRHWQPLARLLSLEKLVDSDVSERWANRESIEAALKSWLAERPVDDAVATLVALGVPCGVSAAASRIRQDDHLGARRVFRDVAHAKLGTVSVIGSPIRFASSGADATLAEPSPLLGEHTDEVLRNVLGIDEAGLTELRHAGAIS